MRRKRKIPTKPNFKRAAKRAYDFLVELDIKELPVNPHKIIEMFDDKWHLISWSELKSDTGVDDPLYLKRDNAEAKTQIERGTGDYLIVYDDSFSRERIRWTIAHEMGHILLGHLVYYEETALNRGGLTKNQYGVLEVEAHWFAEALLAPNYLLRVFNITDSQKISFLCDISKESADKCALHIKKNNYRTNPAVERILRRNFFDFFYKKRYLQSIAEGIFKFHSSYLYDEFYKICRICRECKSYVVDKNQNYCHTCGARMPMYDWPFKVLPFDGVWKGWPEYLEGEFYPYIETDDSNQVLFCPVCKNHVYSEGAEYCKICGTPLKNTCLHENKEVSGECRYCPDCGQMTKYDELGIFDNLKEVELPDLLAFEGGIYEDYIEYEHWNYIVATIYHLENNMELYSALAGSKAIRDEGSLIVFAADSMSADVVLKHKSLLMSCIRKYGKTIITEMGCWYDL